MKETSFIIVKLVGDELSYWHLDKGWVEDLMEATTFPRDILTTPLPPEAMGVLEFSEAWKPLGYYEPPPWGLSVWNSKNMKRYPVIEYTSLPKECQKELCEHLDNNDIHAHNGVYVDFNLEDIINPSPLTNYIFSTGIKPEDEKVLIHINY